MDQARSVTRRSALIGLGALAVAGYGTAQAAVRPDAPGTLLWMTEDLFGVGGLTAADGLVCGFSDGVYAYHPATGRLVWHVDGGNVAQGVVSSGGQLTVANLLRPGFYSLDAGTGRTVWTYAGLNVGSLPWPGLAYADGRVYGFGPAGEQSVVVALDNSGGRLEWRTTLLASAQVSYITAGGGAVYLGGSIDNLTANELIALDAATGAPLWSTSSSKLPLAAGVTAGVVYGRTGATDVSAADAVTGAPLWSHPASWAFTANASTMFVSNSPVIDLAMSGDVTALDIATGRTIWQRNFPQRVPTILTATGSVLYGAERHGTVYALSARTGQELWRHSLPIPGDEVDELNFLVVAGGSVIAANVDQLYALRA
jgi:eukaryotic-like serine/threonine-protein kinase